MKFYLAIIAILLAFKSYATPRTIHVFVALCDNEFQGIVPVPGKLGNGKDTRSNLYWGAAYGVKSFLKYKTTDWKLVRKIETTDHNILERILFKHVSKDLYLLADAYDGEKIKNCTVDFLKASNTQNKIEIKEEGFILNFGGSSNLIAYIGHDGLMDFDVNIDYIEANNNSIDVIILACYSREYFTPQIKKTKANPILWTTHLMAPEAYTLKKVIDGWINNESGKQIEERAAQVYHKYQKCGINGARNLFTTGYKTN